MRRVTPVMLSGEATIAWKWVDADSEVSDAVKDGGEMPHDRRHTSVS
jgi:hypothetical protein